MTNMLGTVKARVILLVLATTLFAASLTASSATAFVDRDCSDFPTWKKAQRFFKTHNPKKDPHGLDRDNDGIACESLRY
jgi:hypothetical protein